MAIKLGIIGSGFGMYGLLPAFSHIEECNVISICGKNSERMQKSCKNFGITRYENWEEMLQTENLEAVAISVIPKYQYKIAKTALENEIAVFAEKPLTTSFKTSKELFNLAVKKNLPNIVDFIFPEIPEWKKTKQILTNEIIGEILSVNVTWNFFSYNLKNQIPSWKTNVDEGGGALSFYFSHVFHYLEFFLGSITNLKCKLFFPTQNFDTGDTGISMSFSFANGCKGHAQMDISGKYPPIHKIEFLGKNGTISLQNTSSDFVDNFKIIVKTEHDTQKIESPIDSTFTSSSIDDSRIKVIFPIAKRFIDWCNIGVGAKPNFGDGVRVQKLIELARNSSNISNLE